MAIHPSGHFFVVGHVDGSFAFWAVEDDDKPLFVRTLDEVNVNIVDGNALDRYLPGGEGSSTPHTPREPIFKLAWSGYPNSTDPRGGETSLIILGGQYAHDPAGVNVLWLPAFNPHTAPPLPGESRGLHPHYRQAMRAAVEVRDAYFYATSGLTQDFLLIPRDSPHYNGTWDPIAILYLSEGSEHSRTIEAFDFPPPSFLSSTDDTPSATKSTSSDSGERVEEDLASTLRDLEVSSDPAKLPTDPLLWNGPAGVVSAVLTSTDLFAHESLSAVQESDPDEFRLEGGVAIADQDVVRHVRLSKVTDLVLVPSDSRRLIVYLVRPPSRTHHYTRGPNNTLPRRLRSAADSSARRAPCLTLPDNVALPLHQSTVCPVASVDL